ncbi:hypothetical protein PQX77_011637 [Marasmius sp. AFHP31]|nr:hypothetical protein PQX77_011637 [Marasmius sp. AFHP31]
MTSVAHKDSFDQVEMDELDDDPLAGLDSGSRSSDIEIVDVVKVEEKASEALKPCAKSNGKQNKRIKKAVEPKKTKPAAKSGQRASKQANTAQVVELTIFCYIAKPALANRKHKRAKEDSWLEKPGFKFPSDKTYTEFLEAVAKILPCDVDNLAAESFRWKPTKPASAKTLIIGNDDGYRALLENARQDSKEQLMICHQSLLPPFARQDAGAEAPSLDYNALACAKTKTHISEQKVTVAKQLSSVTMELEEEYPVGNVDGFPDKRNYVNKHGHMWELTKLRLNNWASHNISPGPGQSGCDIKNPPHTSHFDVDQHIRVLSKSKSMNPVSQEPPLPLSTTPVPAPVATVPSTPTPMSSDASQLLAVVALKMLTDLNRKDMDREERNRYNETSHSVATNPPPAVPHTPQPAPSPKKSYGVPLTDFCKKYDLSSEDESRLEKLRYRPGDKNVECLEEADWRNVGFQKLQWFSVLDAHDRFLNDFK